MSLYKRFLACVDFRLDYDRGGVCTQEIRKRRLCLALFIAITAFVTRGQCSTVLFTITIRHWPEDLMQSTTTVFSYDFLMISDANSRLSLALFLLFAIFMNRDGWCRQSVNTLSNSGIALLFLLCFVGTHVREKILSTGNIKNNRKDRTKGKFIYLLIKILLIFLYSL